MCIAAPVQAPIMNFLCYAVFSIPPLTSIFCPLCLSFVSLHVIQGLCSKRLLYCWAELRTHPLISCRTLNNCQSILLGCSRCAERYFNNWFSGLTLGFEHSCIAPTAQSVAFNLKEKKKRQEMKQLWCFSWFLGGGPYWASEWVWRGDPSRKKSLSHFLCWHGVKREVNDAGSRNLCHQPWVQCHFQQDKRTLMRGFLQEACGDFSVPRRETSFFQSDNKAIS